MPTLPRSTECVERAGQGVGPVRAGDVGLPGAGTGAAAPGAGRQGRGEGRGRAAAAEAAGRAAPAAAPRRARTAPPEAEVDAPLGDRGVGADRRLPALPLGLLHRRGHPPVHGAAGQRGRARRRWSRSSRRRSRSKKFQEAYDACRDNESFLARLVRTGIANLPNGRPEAKEAMNAMTEEIVTGMEQRISYLAIIGQLGPMIGLVGTIWGMIMSFQEIATAAGSQPKPEKVAEGISTALFITLEGVSLSVPAIFFFAFFRNRIALMTMEATQVADRTINSLVAAAKQAKTA